MQHSRRSFQQICISVRQERHYSGLYTDEGRRYDEVRNLYIEQLAFRLVDYSTASTTRSMVKTKIASFVEGNLGHASEVLCALLEIGAGDGEITAPKHPLSKVSFTSAPAAWSAYFITRTIGPF